MAFNPNIPPDQLGKGQMRPKGVNERMNQGSNYQPHERDLFKTMKQGSLPNERPSGQVFVGRRMKQGGPG